VGDDESSHLYSLEKSFPFVDASFGDHQDLESGAYSNEDTEASEASLGAGQMMLREMMIPLMLFQFHSELSNLSDGDLAEAADRLDKNCILSST
jgi:hypothetical protein